MQRGHTSLTAIFIYTTRTDRTKINIMALRSHLCTMYSLTYIKIYFYAPAEMRVLELSRVRGWECSYRGEDMQHGVNVPALGRCIPDRDTHTHTHPKLSAPRSDLDINTH